MRVYSDVDVTNILNNSMEVVLVVSSKEDTYQRIKCSELFSDLLDDTGSYKDLIEKLCFHLSDSDKKLLTNIRFFYLK